MKIAYFDCFAGAGGDMVVAAMLDAALDAELLKTQLTTLGLNNLDIKISKTTRAGLRATSFAPAITEPQQHRSLKQITEIIRQSKIAEQAKKTAVSIFDKLARAEASVHGKKPENIHFHEIGAVDSIIDIVSASIGFDFLKKSSVEKVYSSTLRVGGGTATCAHGLLPAPAPATAELLKGIPIAGGPQQREMLTPTAAAILTTIVDEFAPLPLMKIETIGYGAGSHESEDFPNVLRLILGRTVTIGSETADSVCLLETNIDDATGELISSVIDNLFDLGALDVFTTPIYAKYNRPAVKLSAICKIEDAAELEQAIFQQGLTFGIRKQLLQRSKLAKDFVTTHTEFGPIKIKIGLLNGKIVNAKPEFQDCSATAKKHNVPIKTVQNAAMAAFKMSNQKSDT